MEDQDKITYFGETDFRSKKTRFGIKARDRTRHMYVIGKTGTGKSTLLENMVIQDIQNGEGVCVIDPHGSLAEKVLDFVPEHRIKDVVYFAPFDSEFPMSFNVLEDIGEDKRHLVVSGLMSVFKKIWQDAWSARMEYILNNTLLALLEYPDSTLMGVNRMLSDKDFRKKIVENVKDPAVKSFWVDEYAKYTEKFAAEATPAIQNKIGQYTLNPLIRNIIGQPKSSFDIREIMDKKKIFIINLSKGRIGEQNMNLLGGMFVTKIYLAAMSRAELHERDIEKLPPFYFYVDEFQNFANESFAQILSEARKYKLALTVANQYVTQMVDEVRDAILGNVGTMLTFRIGPTDAEVFEKEFAPTFVAQDLTNLGFAQIYLRLMINGMTSKPFSAITLPPIERPGRIFHEEIIDSSRSLYAKPKKEVEELIKAWHEEGKEPPREKKEYVPLGERPSGAFTKPGEAGFVPKTQTPYSAPMPATPPNPALEAAKNLVRPARPKELPVEKPVARLAPMPMSKPVEKVFTAPTVVAPPVVSAPIQPVRPTPPTPVVEKKPAPNSSPKLKSILEMLEGKEAGSVAIAPEAKVAEASVTPPPQVVPFAPVVEVPVVPALVPQTLEPITRPLFANAIKSKSPTRAASPESLSALREALGAVMAENASLEKSESIVIPDMKPFEPAPVAKEPEVVFEPVLEIKAEPTPASKPMPKVQAPTPFVSMPEPTPTGGSMPNEVPEDILKKILE